GPGASGGLEVVGGGAITDVTYRPRIGANGPATLTLDGLAVTFRHVGSVTVGGASALTVDDSARVAGTTYTVTGTTVRVAGAAPLTYAGLSLLAVTGGAGDDTFTVGSPLPAIPVTLDGGGGANTLKGPNRASTWSVSAVNGGSVGAVSFAAFQNLAG